MIVAGILDLGPHGGYILASYAVAGAILGWMIAASWFANRAAARRLAAIEQQGNNSQENNRRENLR